MSVDQVFLPTDIFELVLSFLLYDTSCNGHPYHHKRDGYILSLRLTCRAWRELIDARCRFIVLFVCTGSGFHREIPDYSTLPRFVLPSFRHQPANTYHDASSSNTQPNSMDAIEGMADFLQCYVPKRALTDRPNLQALQLKFCRWDDKTILHSSPGLKTVWIDQCHDAIEISSLPNLKHLFYSNYGDVGHSRSDVGLVNIHSLGNLKSLTIESPHGKPQVVCMEPAPEVPKRNTIYMEPFETVRSLHWTNVDIFNDDRCWEWTRSVEQVSFSWVSLTKISGPLQIVTLHIFCCLDLLEIDLPEDAPTKLLDVEKCGRLLKIKTACRLRDLVIRDCNGLQSVDVCVMRGATYNLESLSTLRNLDHLRIDVS